jgi:hypothetical protein
MAFFLNQLSKNNQKLDRLWLRSGNRRYQVRIPPRCTRVSTEIIHSNVAWLWRGGKWNKKYNKYLHTYVCILLQPHSDDLKKILGQCLYYTFSTNKHCILSQLYAISLLYLPKNLTPWRDSNPGLLFLRRMRCPLATNELQFSTKPLKNLVCTHTERWRKADTKFAAYWKRNKSFFRQTKRRRVRLKVSLHQQWFLCRTVSCNAARRRAT